MDEKMVLVQRRKDHLEEKFYNNPEHGDSSGSITSFAATMNRSRMSKLGPGVGGTSNVAPTRASKVQKSMHSRRSLSMNHKLGDHQKSFLSHHNTVKSPVGTVNGLDGLRELNVVSESDQSLEQRDTEEDMGLE